VKYAKPKISLKNIRSDENLFLIWIPMRKITYRTGGKERSMCFDAFTPVKIGVTEAFVWLMRNPRDFRLVEDNIPYGIVLPSLISGQRILDILKRIKAETLRALEEVGDTLTKITKRYVVQLLSIFPAQRMESKKLEPYEKWLPIYTLIDAADIDFDTEFVSEDLIYWPIIISKKTGDVFEIALKKEPSQSYGHIHRKHNLIKIALEYTWEQNEQEG